MHPCILRARLLAERPGERNGKKIKKDKTKREREREREKKKGESRYWKQWRQDTETVVVSWRVLGRRRMRKSDKVWRERDSERETETASERVREEGLFNLTAGL